MAGQKKGDFRELISPFLTAKLDEAEQQFGVESREYQALSRQYIKSSQEAIISDYSTRRHYEAELFDTACGHNLVGVERLYRRTVLLEPTTVCAAHCRWCLRGQYDVARLSDTEIDEALSYFSHETELQEVLLTGGDPLMVEKALTYILDGIEQKAPNIQVVRIGTRVPFQSPGRVKGELLKTLTKKRRFRLELGVHVCHPVEFWPESVEVLKVLNEAGVVIYNQHPLLKGVNDDEPTLSKLYDLMRQHGVESHYLFHAIPMRGMDHHRTSIQKGLDIVSHLTSSGYFSGRSKPLFCAMTDIGKIVLYHGSVVKRDREKNRVLLRSGYSFEERVRYNPSWKLPDSAEVDEDGFMNVWYLDGIDDHSLDNLILLTKTVTV